MLCILDFYPSYTGTTFFAVQNINTMADVSMIFFTDISQKNC